jgi:hypothetical protein
MQECLHFDTKHKQISSSFIVRVPRTSKLMTNRPVMAQISHDKGLTKIQPAKISPKSCFLDFPQYAESKQIETGDSHTPS